MNNETRQHNYFELKRGLTYRRTQDPLGKFVYRLHKHYLQYKPLYNESGWRPVWTIEYYDEAKSSYVEIK